MKSFKTWLSEANLSSDGTTDMEPTQTAQATSKVGDWALSNPSFSDDVARIQQTMDNPAVTRRNMVDLFTTATQQAPGNMAVPTNAMNVARYAAPQLGIKPDIFPSIRRMMKKKMKKGMKK